MVMIGYGENHARDVYRMYNPVTSKVVETRDVHVWADITNAANDIRLTLDQVFDPELILEEAEVPEEVVEEVKAEQSEESSTEESEAGDAAAESKAESTEA